MSKNAGPWGRKRQGWKKQQHSLADLMKRESANIVIGTDASAVGVSDQRPGKVGDSKSREAIALKRREDARVFLKKRGIVYKNDKGNRSTNESFGSKLLSDRSDNTIERMRRAKVTNLRESVAKRDEWRRANDPTTGKVYWWNPTTRETSWFLDKNEDKTSSSAPEIDRVSEEPSKPLSPWIPVTDSSTGRTYLWNCVTDAVKWDNEMESMKHDKADREWKYTESGKRREIETANESRSESAAAAESSSQSASSSEDEGDSWGE